MSFNLTTTFHNQSRCDPILGKRVFCDACIISSVALNCRFDGERRHLAVRTDGNAIVLFQNLPVLRPKKLDVFATLQHTSQSYRFSNLGGFILANFELDDVCNSATRETLVFFMRFFF